MGYNINNMFGEAFLRIMAECMPEKEKRKMHELIDKEPLENMGNFYSAMLEHVKNEKNITAEP